MNIYLVSVNLKSVKDEDSYCFFSDFEKARAYAEKFREQIEEGVNDDPFDRPSIVIIEYTVSKTNEPVNVNRHKIWELRVTEMYTKKLEEKTYE